MNSLSPTGMMRMKNIHIGYSTLLKEVEPRLNGFKSDITTHDKTMLSGYSGEFVVGYRESGTNLYRLNMLDDACRFVDYEIKKNIAINLECSLAFLSNNKNFLLVDTEGKSKAINQDEACALLMQRSDEVLSLADFLEKINLRQIAFELMTFIKYNKRVWKKRLREDFESGRSTPALQRLRNHFEHNVLFAPKFITEADNEMDIFCKLAQSYVSSYGDDCYEA